jgi:uncharacterized protein
MAEPHSGPGARARFLSQVAGPHFETICRDYTIAADLDVFGGLPGEVGSGVVADSANRAQIEVDVVVLAAARSWSGRDERGASAGRRWRRPGFGHVRHLSRTWRNQRMAASPSFRVTSSTGVELVKLGRKVEVLLDEEILDRGLDGSLPFREKRLKVVPGERITERGGGRGWTGRRRW